MKTLFDKFNEGIFTSPYGNKAFADLKWNAHPVFEGVELKHLLTASDTGGGFSYHLVRIEPGKCIGEHIHDSQLETHEVIAGSGYCINEGIRIPYESGVVTILKRGHLIWSQQMKTGCSFLRSSSLLFAEWLVSKDNMAHDPGFIFSLGRFFTQKSGAGT